MLARAWAGELPAGLDEAAEEALALGVPEAAVAALRRTKPEVDVWPENRAAFEAFIAVDTQWQAITLADGRVHYLGLNHQACEASWRLAGIAIDPATFEGVRIMERAARAALNGVRSTGQ